MTELSKMEIIEGLDEIFKEFDELREQYGSFILTGSYDVDALCLFRTRFTDLQAAVIPSLSVIHGLKVSRDDGARSALKSQLTTELVGTKGPDGKTLTLSSANTIAGSQDEYKEFIAERILYYESFSKISSLFHSLDNYVHDIAGRIGKSRSYNRVSARQESDENE